MTNQVVLTIKEVKSIAAHVGLLKSHEHQAIIIITNGGSIGQTTKLTVGDYEVDVTDYEAW